MRLIREVERAGLTGRGGAHFPTARKLAAVAAGPGPVVVANGTEGEPASAKDKILLARSPHLVLDGAAVAAGLVGAREACLVVPHSVRDIVDEAVAERRRDGHRQVRFRVVTAADRFVAGEASAVVHWIERGVPAPLPKPPRLAEHGLGGRPTLVQNVETLAHLALIGRQAPGGSGRWARRPSRAPCSSPSWARCVSRASARSPSAPRWSRCSSWRAVCPGRCRRCCSAATPGTRPDGTTWHGYSPRRAWGRGRRASGPGCSRCAPPIVRPDRDRPRDPLPRGGVGGAVRAVPVRAGRGGRRTGPPGGRLPGQPGHAAPVAGPGGRAGRLRPPGRRGPDDRQRAAASSPARPSSTPRAVAAAPPGRRCCRYHPGGHGERPGAPGVDPIACDGRGLCAEALPELITLDDWGFPVIRPGGVPAALAGEARETVRICPEARRSGSAAVPITAEGRRPARPAGAARPGGARGPQVPAPGPRKSRPGRGIRPCGQAARSWPAWR